MLCNNYLNGKIYILKSLNTCNVYIGSTCLLLSTRLSLHKSKYKEFLNGGYSYLSSFEVLKYGDVYIELLEDIPCINNKLLLKKEGEYMEKIKCVNKNRAGRTKQEYNKLYYINNKHHLSTRIICECCGVYRIDSKFKHTQTNKHKNYINSKNNILLYNIECPDLQENQQQDDAASWVLDYGIG